MSLRTGILPIGLAGALLVSACATGRPPAPGAPAHARPVVLRVKMPGSGAIRRVPLEDYVRGAVVAELGPGAHAPAVSSRLLDLQAIVARTFAVAHPARHRREGYDLCSSTHCQLYNPRPETSSWTRAAADATRRTAGTVLWFGGAPASALFHADCGGHTSSAGDVWGGTDHPYLAAVSDGGPAGAVHSRWRFEVDTPKLRAALNADSRTRVGRDLSRIRVIQRDRGGRAALVLLQGTREPVVRGEELRSVIARAFGPRSLRSTLFDVQVEAGRFVFNGQGFGHGVGLCQAGALARIRAGATAEQVLATYYPGTRLGTLR